MMNAGKYDRALSRKYPGLFVILLDQSASMDQVDEERGASKADIATAYVNKIIQSMIDSAETDEYTGRRKNYAYLSVLGYNDKVYPLLRNTHTPVDLATLDENPRGHLPIEFVIRNKATGQITRTVKKKEPFWVKPMAEGNTQMKLAFEGAKQVVERWLASPPEFIAKDLGSQAPREECFPPIIINITDAKHNGDGNPEEVASEIQSLSTQNGNVLIFNCHFTHERSQPSMFPKSVAELERFCTTNLDRRLVRQMFDMSSPLPDELLNKASKRMEQPIERGARCFVYNANPDILLRFLSWSTKAARIGGG